MGAHRTNRSSARWLVAAMNASQLFRVPPALQNLADRATRLVARVDVEAESADGFEKGWLRSAVEEHFDEAGVGPDIQLH